MSWNKSAFSVKPSAKISDKYDLNKLLQKITTHGNASILSPAEVADINSLFGENTPLGEYARECLMCKVDRKSKRNPVVRFSPREVAAAYSYKKRGF